MPWEILVGIFLGMPPGIPCRNSLGNAPRNPFTNTSRKEMAERFEQYPINEIAQKNKYKPLKLGDPKQTSKYSIFIMLGDEHSIDFFKAAEGDLVASGADIYVLAGKDVNSFYAYTCGSTELKMEILRGLDTTLGSDSCNQAMMIRKGTAVRATAELLGIKRVPFAIINANDNGAVINYKSFGSLK